MGRLCPGHKIIGADHGLHIASHRSTLRVADRLTALIGQQDEVATQTLIAGLGLARSLHTHFYENDLPDTTVTASVDGVFSAIDLLQRLFPGNGDAGGGHGDADT